MVFESSSPPPQIVLSAVKHKSTTVTVVGVQVGDVERLIDHSKRAHGHVSQISCVPFPVVETSVVIFAGLVVVGA